MTDIPIEDLKMSDTEYAELIAQGYDPNLEQQLIGLGEHPDIARKMARFFGLLRGKTLETHSEREELTSAWETIWAKDRISTDQVW